MGEVTGISWTHATLNFWVGCTKVSNGEQGACAFCYAETWALRWPAYRETWGVGAQRVRFKDTRAKALKLERLAVASGAPFYCFSNSLSDMMDKEVQIGWLAEAFDDMRAAPHVTFLVLTKRAPLIQKRVLAAGGLPPNVALGITVVTQEEADRDIPHLLTAKAALQPALAFLSMEPLMGAVDLTRLNPRQSGALGTVWTDALAGHSVEAERADDPDDVEILEPCVGIDWVITGGESGHKARPTHPDWLRSIRDQCAAAGVPYHHKQNGEWGPDPDLGRDFLSSDVGVPMGSIEHLQSSKGSYAVAWERLDDDGAHARGIQLKRVGKKRSGRLLDGVLHDAMPEIANAPEGA